MINLAIAEDNGLALKSVQEKLSPFIDVAIKITAPNGKELLTRISSQLIDVVLMDIEMPLLNGIETTKLLKASNPSVKILALTTFDDDDKIFEMLISGASGYVLKDETPENLYKAIHDVTRGGAFMSASIALKVINIMKNLPSSESKKVNYELTQREVQILEQLKSGLTYNQIADNLFISYGTVRKHVENIYKKLQVNNKVSAIQKAVESRIC